MSDLEEEAKDYKIQFIDNRNELDVMSRAKADFTYWSKMPFWSLGEGIALLLGKDPETVNWGVIRNYINYYFSSELCLDYYKLRNLVLRALDMQEIDKTNPPAIFLEWAESRGIEVPAVLRQQVAAINNTISCTTENLVEMENALKIKDEEIRALKEKLNTSQKRIEELEALVWEGFDENSSTYSKELAIAVRAHGTISKTWKTGSSIKSQISLWLDKNYPKLSNQEKERIATLCNWQKSGGAPHTP